MTESTVRVLVVDDGLNFREAAQALLRSYARVEVVGAVESGPAAVTAAQILNPDLVLMDLDMPPGINGLEATREIKRTHRHIKVAIVTLHDWPWNRDAAIESQADAFISKSSFSDGCRSLLAGWYGVGSGAPVAHEH